MVQVGALTRTQRLTRNVHVSVTWDLVVVRIRSHPAESCDSSSDRPWDGVCDLFVSVDLFSFFVPPALVLLGRLVRSVHVTLKLSSIPILLDPGDVFVSDPPNIDQWGQRSPRHEDVK